MTLILGRILNVCKPQCLWPQKINVKILWDPWGLYWQKMQVTVIIIPCPFLPMAGESLRNEIFFSPLLTCFSSLKLSFLCSFSPFLIFLFSVCFALGSACWATAPFHLDTLMFALRPRMLTTWQCHQSCGDSSVTQVSFLMPPVMSTLFTIMSPQSKAFLGWLVVSLLVS